MEPIRVLQVVTIMNRGGLETMLMNYYRQLDRTKVQFDFMVHREEEGDYDNEIIRMGGKIYKMPPIRPGNYRKYFKELESFFKTNKKYKVVHAHINENSAFVLKYAKKANISGRIAHSHLAGLPLDYKLPFRLYAKMNLNENSNHFFACSKEAGDWLFGSKKTRDRQIKVFKNAINCKEFSFNASVRKNVREALKIEDKFVIGHVGRFNSQKNHSFLIDIFNEVYKKNNKAVLLLIGVGNLEKEIKGKVKRLNLCKSVIFLGLRSDISELMQAMDVFLFPSFYEGLGVVLIEAQAAGLKCITSTGVPIEADVTKTVDFLDLKKPADYWAQYVLRNTQIYERNLDMKSIINNGYDVSTNINWLSKLYVSHYL